MRNFRSAHLHTKETKGRAHC